MKRAKFLLICLVALLTAPNLYSQLPSLSPRNDEKQPEKPSDPYGRTSPRSTFLNFITAAQRDNVQVAAHYLQMPGSTTEERRQRAVKQLYAVLDQGFHGDIDEIHRADTGSLTDGLPPELEKAGTVEIGNDQIEILLVRVPTADGPIWQISAETLAQIPRLYAQIGTKQWETRLPRWLVDYTVFQMPLWTFLGAILLVPVAFGLAILIVAALTAAYRRVRHKVNPGPFVDHDQRPFVFIAAILLHYLAVNELGIPLLYRQYYTRFIGLLVIFGLGWLVFRAIDRIGARLSEELANRGSAQSAFMLAKRIVKAIVFGALVLIALQHLGFNVAPALATVGIGGLAVALAAQKSLENLFGGISVLSDSAIRVGDYVRLDTLAGTVEDIGLRSTRIRTLERTVVSVPNGLLSNQNLENFAVRDMFWFHPVLTLRYETTPDQMRAVLADLRKLLYSHAKVRQDGARARLIDFGPSSLNVEIFSYVLAADFNEFLAIKEDLMLRIMDIIQSAGTGFAFPSQTLYLSRDSGLDEEASRKAEDRIRQMADRQQLPFPDYTKEQIEQAKGSIEYPPRTSVSRQQ